MGAAIGIPVLWVVMTLGFLVITDQGFINVAGFAALPAFFCGPFLGGLFTTSMVHAAHDHDEAEPAAPPIEMPQAA